MSIQAWPCSLAEVCPLRKGHSDLQEVTNLARIRWGPCTRAQALPHLPWVTQSGSESRRGGNPWSVEGPGAAPAALEGFALHEFGLMAQTLPSSL